MDLTLREFSDEKRIPYFLEFDEPIATTHAWRFETHHFAATSDETAAAQLVSFVAARFLAEEGGAVRYPRLRCCINRATGRQIALPAEAIAGLPAQLPELQTRTAA